MESWEPLGISRFCQHSDPYRSTEPTLLLYILVLVIRMMLLFFDILFSCWIDMVAFCSLIPISFDVALLLLMTLPRCVKSSTSSDGSWSCRWSELDETKAILSANSRSSKIDVMVHLIPLRLLPTVFLITESISTRNNNGYMMHPCLTPLLMLNQLLNLLSSIMLQVKLLLKALKILISLSGHPCWKYLPKALTMYAIKCLFKVDKA